MPDDHLELAPRTYPCKATLRSEAAKLRTFLLYASSPISHSSSRPWRPTGITPLGAPRDRPKEDRWKKRLKLCTGKVEV